MARDESSSATVWGRERGGRGTVGRRAHPRSPQLFRFRRNGATATPRPLISSSTPPSPLLVSAPSSPPPSPFPVPASTMSWRAASVMERALLERCPNTLLSRRASEPLKPRVAVSELRGLRPIATKASSSIPGYTSLAEIIPTPGSPAVERATSPRTPMRNRLVEKAARAYLLPSDSFNRRGAPSRPWAQSLSRFLPRLSVISMAFNPFHAFSSAFNVFRVYLTGSRALSPPLVTPPNSRAVARSVSMPVRRTPYSLDLSTR